MTELAVMATALLIFESANRSVLRKRMVFGEIEGVWFLIIAGVTYWGHTVFGRETLFLPAVSLLLLTNLLRTRLGFVEYTTSFLERWRYAPAPVILLLTGSFVPVAPAYLVMALGRRDASSILRRTFRPWIPASLPSGDLDPALPPPAEGEPKGREAGMLLIEVTVGMMLLVTVSVSLFTVSAQRAGRLRLLRETAGAREAATSALERVLAVTFEELSLHDGEAFPVPGDGEAGEVRIEFPEDGLARIEVTAPRRGATPIKLTTLRTRRLP